MINRRVCDEHANLKHKCDDCRGKETDDNDSDYVVIEDYDESAPLPKYIDVGPYKLRYAFDSEGNYDFYDVTDREGEYIGELDADDVRKALPYYDTDSREAEMMIIDMVDALDDDDMVDLDFEAGFEDDEIDECIVKEDSTECDIAESSDENDQSNPLPKKIKVGSYELEYGFDSDTNRDFYDVTSRKGDYIGELDAEDVRKAIPPYAAGFESEELLLDMIEDLKDDDAMIDLDFEPGFEADELDEHVVQEDSDDMVEINAEEYRPRRRHFHR